MVSKTFCNHFLDILPQALANYTSSTSHVFVSLKIPVSEPINIFRDVIQFVIKQGKQDQKNTKQHMRDTTLTLPRPNVYKYFSIMYPPSMQTINRQGLHASFRHFVPDANSRVPSRQQHICLTHRPTAATSLLNNT
jgi:hypothetical protein